MRPQAVSGMRSTACGSEELATASGPEQTSDSHTVLGTGWPPWDVRQRISPCRLGPPRISPRAVCDDRFLRPAAEHLEGHAAR